MDDVEIGLRRNRDGVSDESGDRMGAGKGFGEDETAGAAAGTEEDNVCWWWEGHGGEIRGLLGRGWVVVNTGAEG